MNAIEKACDTTIAQSSAPSLFPTRAKPIHTLPTTASVDRPSMERQIATTCSLRDSIGPVDTGVMVEGSIPRGKECTGQRVQKGYNQYRERVSQLPKVWGFLFRLN